MPTFPLTAFKVSLGELVDGFVEKRGGTHRRLADRQVQYPPGLHVVGNELLERVLDDALGETFRRVVAGGLFSVAAGQAVDEAAFAMDLDLPQAIGAGFEYTFFLGVFVQFAQGYKPGVREFVRVFPRLLHFVQVLFREEAVIGEQRLVHGTELVDAELGVRDAATTPVPAFGRAGERHQADDPLQDFIAELYAVQQGRCALAEQAAVEGSNLERIVERPSEDVAVAAVEAVPDQAKQSLDALVDVVAVQGFVADESHEFQVAQVLQAVALAIRLGVDGRVAKLRKGFDIEQEQQSVHVAQGFQSEFVGELLVKLIHALLAYFAQIPDDLVADEFDGFAQRVLEIVGNGEGVLVAVVVEAIVQA